MPTPLTQALAAPAIKLMDRMRLPRKLLLLGGVLTFGWITVLAMLTPRLLNEQRLVNRELAGVDGIVALGNFMTAVQDHRRAIRLYSKGDSKAAQDLPNIDARTDFIASSMDHWMQGPGAGLGLSPRWREIREQWRDVSAKGTQGDLADSIEHHNQLVAKATAVIGLISDDSGLTLDPEMSSSFLVDALSQIPPIGAELTIVRGTGWGALIDGRIEEDTRTDLIRHSTLLQNIMDRIASDLQKASALDPAMQSAQIDGQTSARTVELILRAVDANILGAQVRSENAPAFRRLGDDAWNSLTDLRKASASELTRVLSERAARLRRQAQITIAVCVTALLLSAFVFLGFVESLRRSLDSISMNARQLARGNFPDRIELSARDEMRDIADELEVVSRSLKAMTDSLQQTLALQTAIVDSSNLGIIAADEAGLIVSFNRAAQRMLGYEEGEIVGSKHLDFAHDPIELAVHAEQLGVELGRAVPAGVESLVAKSRARTDQVDEQEWTYVRRDGSRFPVLLPVTAIRDRKAALIGFLAVAHDISERKLKDLAIARSLKEKDTLLKEVYHRVKNNLQVISSLFDLQLRSLPDGPAHAALKDGASRVSAMALVHEKLYQSGTLSSISLQTYVEDFCERLSTASSTHERGINVITEVAPIEVSMDTAVPLGLWINEVISNSMKHGFPDGRPGTIRIKVERDGDSAAAITVSDDGIGIPAGAPRKPKSLGMKLVAALSEQLDGTYSIDSGNGVTVRLRFPLPVA